MNTNIIIKVNLIFLYTLLLFLTIGFTYSRSKELKSVKKCYTKTENVNFTNTDSLFTNKTNANNHLIELTSAASKVNVYENTYFYLEKGYQPFNLNRLSQAPFYKAEKLYYYYPSLNSETLWMKFTVENKTSNNLIYYYILRHAYLYKGTVYLNINNTVKQLHTYSYQNINKATTYSNFPTWKLHLPKKSKITVYAKVFETGGRTKISSLLLNENDFLKHTISSFIIHTSFIVFSLIIIIISFYISKYSKKPFVIFYGFYVGFLCIDYLCVNGIGQSYIWTNNDFLIKNTRSISNASSAFFLCLFFYFFYGTYKYSKVIKIVFKLFYITFGCFLVLYIVKFFFGGLTSLFLYVWKTISLLALALISIHTYLGFKKDIPFYLPVVFIFHTAITFINANYNFPYSNNPILDWLYRNIYYASLSIEIVIIIYFISNVLKKEKLAFIALKNEFDFLQQELNKLKKTAKNNNLSNNKHINLKSKAVLNSSEILYIKSDGHYIEYYIENKPKPEIDRNSLTEALKILPTNSFVRIHKSFIVNIYHLKIINSTKVMLDNGVWINLSRTYKQHLKDILHKED